MSESSLKDLPKIIAFQKEAFNQNPNSSWSARKNKLKALSYAITAHEDEFIQAISDDFGHRAPQETVLAEFLVIHAGISHAIKHTPKWMRVRKAKTALHYLPASNKIIPQPLGVIGIISPWNYPLQLAIMPLIGALGAGNRVMLKPSEYTPRLSKTLKSVLGEVFNDEEVFVATGGVDVATAFSKLAFDHLVFTGSTNVGRMVAKAASENLVPCTLELGGKSPAIIDESADMRTTVARLANSKLLNAGQTCVAPDYVLMPADKIDAFCAAMIKQAETFYPNVAGNSDYTSIIADNHYSRLQYLLEDAVNKGATIQVAGTDGAQQLANERRMPLTLVTNTTPDMNIMQEEIFGPLLPVVPSESLDHALGYVQKRDRPLGLYWFGNDKAKETKVLHQSISGGVSINDAAWQVIQEGIPFGGVGPSGMGAYHGEHGFNSFSHLKGVFKQSRFSQGKQFHPPYGPKTEKMFKLMRKII